MSFEMDYFRRQFSDMQMVLTPDAPEGSTYEDPYIKAEKKADGWHISGQPIRCPVTYKEVE